MKHYVLLLFIGFSFIGCNSSQPAIPEIILSLRAPETQLKISDLAENIRFVPLETNDSVLLPDRFNILVGKNDILSISGNEIHQFDTSGKHIRLLARKGRAPEEFEYCNGAIIDDKNGLLYVQGFSETAIIYNLQNGKFIERKKFPLPIKKILSIQGDSILFQPLSNRGDTLKHSLCLTNARGEILNSLPCCHVSKDFEMINCYQLPDGKIRLQSPNHPDSLFTIDHFRVTPYATIKCIGNDDPKFSLYHFPNFENSQCHLISITPISVLRNDEGVINRVTIKETYRFFVDKQEYTGKLLKELYIDPWDVSIPVENLSLTEQFIFPVKARILREIAEKQLQKGEISPALERIYQNTQEEDNPILILGKCKP